MENKFDIIDKYLNGEMSVREQNEFEEKIRNDSELMKEYIFRRDLNKAISEQDIMDLRDQLKDVVKSESTNKFKRIDTRIIVSVAAVFIGLIIISGILLNKRNIDNDLIFNNYYKKYPSVISVRSISENEYDKLFIKSFDAYEQDNYDRVITNINQLLLKDEKNNLLLFYLAIAELEQEKLNESEKHFSLLIQDPNHIFWEQAHWYLALNYIKQNKISNAKEILNRIVEQNFSMSKKADSLLSEIN